VAESGLVSKIDLVSRIPNSIILSQINNCHIKNENTNNRYIYNNSANLFYN
jgi:hypothetical protein